jgi:hypothetical protein
VWQNSSPARIIGTPCPVIPITSTVADWRPSAELIAAMARLLRNLPANFDDQEAVAPPPTPPPTAPTAATTKSNRKKARP